MLRAMLARERKPVEPLTCLDGAANCASGCSGMTFLKKTVYGDPLTIELMADGP